MVKTYYKVLINGAYEHIRNIGEHYIQSFWELMESVNHNFEVNNDEYIQIIESLKSYGNATVGDYDITIIDNIDNLLLEALEDIKEQDDEEE